MKPVLYCLIIILLLVVAVGLAAKPVILVIARGQIAGIFIDSSVFIGSCEWAPLHQIRFLGISIKRDGIYEIKLKEADIRYSFPSVFRKTVSKIILKEGFINLNLPRQNISEFSRYLNLGSGGEEGGSSAGDLKLDQMDFEVKAKDISFKARVSMDISLEQKLINAIDLDVSLLTIRGLRFDGVGLKAGELQRGGNFTVGKIQYDKIKAVDIKGTARLKDNILFLDAVSARLFEGKIAGQITFKVAPIPEYLADIRLTDLNLKDIVDDFDLKKKFQMSGLAGGQLVLSGTGSHLNILSGDFSVGGAGGVLVIEDTRFIENMAKSAHQPADLLVESFKNYHYNTAVIKLSLQEKNLILDMALEGEAGKRNLNITVHDFISTKD